MPKNITGYGFGPVFFLAGIRIFSDANGEESPNAFPEKRARPPSTLRGFPRTTHARRRGSHALRDSEVKRSSTLKPIVLMGVVLAPVRSSVKLNAIDLDPLEPRRKIGKLN